jgi:hypothetical protein
MIELRATLIGASGIELTITVAPFPTLEFCDSPTPLKHTILAYTLSPVTKLNGAAIKTLIGIVHSVFAMISAVEPLQ